MTFISFITYPTLGFSSKAASKLIDIYREVADKAKIEAE